MRNEQSLGGVIPGLGDHEAHRKQLAEERKVCCLWRDLAAFVFLTRSNFAQAEYNAMMKRNQGGRKYICDR